MKKEKRNKTKAMRKVVSLVAVAAVIGTVVVATRVQAARSASDQDPAPQTLTLEKTDITRTVSVSGVVESARVNNIYSTQSYPVKEIHVSVGDSVRAGDVLAELDMSRVENDVSQTEINLRSAITSAQEELRSNSNSIVNARTSLESSLISLARQQLNVASAERDLREAEMTLADEFDSYSYDNAIEDARLSLERRTADLEKAQADLNEAIHDFDDYQYQNSIHDARVSLDRRRAELADAEKTLAEEESGSSYALDSYRSAVNDAARNRERRLDDYNRALNDYSDAERYYTGIESSTSASPQEKAAAEASLESARVAMEAASSAYDDSETALIRANSDLRRTRENAVDSAQRTYDNAANAVSDAQRSYDRAVADLDRARANAVDTATERLTSAQNAFADAQRAYEKALSDKLRAIDGDFDSGESRMDSARRAYEDSLRQLESSQNSVRSAQNTLAQAEEKPATQGTNVELQELSLERLNDQLAEGKIVATADGVITEINVKVGATPSGIIFVIEDTENLHVSARVREHSISSVAPGQRAVITTDATGDAEYGGVLSYISPKAVSAAGSTSVEFEVQAALDDPDTIIRIGMNAFLNIITDHASDVYAVPNSVIVTNENGSFVYASENGESVEIAVTLGITTMAASEISGDGLYDGMQLIIDPEGLLSTGDSPGFPQMFGGRGN